MQAELTNYQEWQLARYKNILPEPVVLPSGQIEGTNEEIDRSAEWVEMQAEKQLYEYEK